MFFDPPSGVVAEIRKNEGRRGERAIAIAERGINPGVPEADDVDATNAVEIAEDPEVFGRLPALCRIEALENKFWRLEGAVAVAERNPNAGVAEPNDVGLAVAGDVDDEAGVLVHAPPLVVSEVCNDEFRRLERAVAVADGGPDAGVAEPNDVGLAVAGHVDDEAGVLVHTPALVVSQVPNDELHALKGAVAVVDRRPDAGVAKADDVRAPIPGQICEHPGMPVDQPAGVIAEATKDHVRRPKAAGDRVE